MSIMLSSLTQSQNIWDQNFEGLPSEKKKEKYAHSANTHGPSKVTKFYKKYPWGVMIKSTVVTPWKEISWGYDQQYICHQGLWSTKHLSPHGVMNNSTLIKLN